MKKYIFTALLLSVAAGVVFVGIPLVAGPSKIESAVQASVKEASGKHALTQKASGNKREGMITLKNPFTGETLKFRSPEAYDKDENGWMIIWTSQISVFSIEERALHNPPTEGCSKGVASWHEKDKYGRDLLACLSQSGAATWAYYDYMPVLNGKLPRKYTLALRMPEGMNLNDAANKIGHNPFAELAPHMSMLTKDELLNFRS